MEQQVILNSFITACYVCFMILLSYKLNVIEHVRVKAKMQFVSRLLSCEFCMCFWTCATVTAASCLVLECTPSQAVARVILATVMSKVLLTQSTV
jgi:hypothetical protein